MKYAVIGSRGFDDEENLFNVLNSLIPNPTVIVSGGAKGADSLAEKWAITNNIKTEIYKPEYNKYPPKVAPLYRNYTIIDNSDKVIAFWDGKSKGTKQALDYAKKKNKEIEVVLFGSVATLKNVDASQTSLNF